MSARFTFRNSIAAMLAAPALVGAGTAYAACTGLGAPTNTETKCLTAVQIPGNPLRSYDISWVNPDRAEYYLADRSNAGIPTYGVTGMFRDPDGGGVHGLNERIRVRSLYEGHEFLYRLVKLYAGGS